MPKRKALRAKRSQYLIETRRTKAEMGGNKLDAECAASRGEADDDSHVSLPPPHSPAFPTTSTTPVPSTSTAAAAVPPSSSQPLPSFFAPRESLLEKRMRILKKEEETLSNGDKVLVPVQHLQSLVENMRCPRKACKKVLQLNITNHWDTTINVTCPHCNNQVCHLPPKTANIPTKEVISESNAIAVHQSIVNNDGFAGLRRLTAAMGLKPMAKVVYRKYCSFLYKHMDEYMEMKRKDVFAALKQVYAEEYGIHPDKDGLLNIEVSFDASWMTRGHKLLTPSPWSE